MRPPALAEALVAAAAPERDYESITGDLHEEYLRFVLLDGQEVANRWYWSQTLLSIPSLLSYSRSNTSPLRTAGVAVVALVVLVGMLLMLAAIETLLQTIFGSIDRGPAWLWFSMQWFYAALIGAILALSVRTDGLRVAFCTALFLVLCFVVPALAGNPHSRAPLPGWILLCGAVPAMCTGAGLYRILRCRMSSAS